MDLQGQGQRGYAMAALLVALAVMAVMMIVVLPVWRHQAQREKEAELVFRGESIVRAIGRWERKNGPGTRPPSLDALVDGRFLRKKYKDPMTEDGEFLPLVMGQQQPGQPTTPQQPGKVTVPGGGAQPGGRGAQPQPQSPLASPTGRGGFTTGGIYGVASKSKESSIKLYLGRAHYNEWQFVYQGAAAGAGGPGRGGPGGGVGRRGAPSPFGTGGAGPGGRGPGGRGGPFDAPPGGRGGGTGRRGGRG